MPARTTEPVGSRTEPDSSISQPQLTDDEWQLIAESFRFRHLTLAAVVREPTSVGAWKAFSGYFAAEPRWKDLPRSFPSYVACWRRLVEWSRDGVWDMAWRRLVEQLDRRGKVDWEQGFADGTFASAKKGAI